MTTTKTKAERDAERDHARDWLAAHLSDGDTLYVKVRYTRGTTRYAQAFIVWEGRIERVTHWVAKATGRRLNKDIELSFGGGGYSVPCDLAYAVCYALRGVEAGCWLEYEAL